MNGSNKKRKVYLWRKSFYLVSVIYFVTIILLSLVVYNVPAVYQAMEDKRIEMIQEQVATIVTTEEEPQINEALNEFRKNEEIELVTIGEQGEHYGTLPIYDFDLLNQWAGDKNFTYYSAYELKGKNQTYQVWLAIYRMDPQTLFHKIVLFLAIGIMILFVIITILVMTMFRNLVTPIKRLRDNLFKLKDFKLSEIHQNQNNRDTEYDAISNELILFTGDLQEKMDTIGVKYSSLEKELQAQKEYSIYKEQMISSLVHDLKTPLSASALQIESIRNSYLHDSFLVEQLDQVLLDDRKLFSEIKELLHFMHTKYDSLDRQKSAFNVLTIVRESLQRFSKTFEKQKIHYLIDIPSDLIISMSSIEFKQLMHNILSNVCQYTDEGGDFSLSIYEMENQLYIEAYNDKQDTSKIDFPKVFDLFYFTKNETNSFSTGVGMYTIKSMIDQYRGTYSFEPKDKGVLLKLTIPFEMVGVKNETNH
ncbi:sensor histidine kinase [Isobaculum melis]|uniref:histidine kinase n=1 Tax=Isobaculum melis TaxID=142588 RepID=A0A1H9SUC0_9LACT|nr:HAMP domain-containing sensor histidine kinase [Isobaculum melis]SER88467.1 Signal transduction histidine kinase [Isobaculum melis]